MVGLATAKNTAKCLLYGAVTRWADDQSLAVSLGELELVRGQLEKRVGYPVQLSAEKLDDEFGLPKN
jgi:hypothetical protein